MAKLKAAILAIQTVGEMYALMEDYSYLEFMQTYSELTQEQQTRLDAIYDGDCQMQMAAISCCAAGQALAVRQISNNNICVARVGILTSADRYDRSGA
jgi:hypothetical protein